MEPNVPNSWGRYTEAEAEAEVVIYEVETNPRSDHGKELLDLQSPNHPTSHFHGISTDDTPQW